MTSKTKDQIKTFFETGDKPTESQFIDLIDSYIDKSGPLGVLETAVSGGSSGMLYASAADVDILNTATSLSRLGITVSTTAQVSAAVSNLVATTAEAVAGAITGKVMNPLLVKQAIQTLAGAYRGAVVYISGTQSITNATDTIINFDSEYIDTDTIHSTSSNTSRMTVPTGITKIRLTGQMQIVDTTDNTARSITFYKNGSAVGTPSPGTNVQTSGVAANLQLQCVSTAITCVAGDYFEMSVRQSSGGSINAQAGYTWFEMQILA